MGCRDMFDDRQPQSGASGGASPRWVDPIEPFEDAVELRGGDADALVRNADVDTAPGRLRHDGHRRPSGAVDDGVLDQVPQRYDELVPVSEDRVAPDPTGDQLHALVGGVNAHPVDGTFDDRVDGYGVHRLQRVVALQPRQLDDLLHQPRQPLALGAHAGGETLHGFRVVRCLGNRLREEL